MSDFRQAIKWLGEGKKVQRDCWMETNPYFIVEKFDGNNKYGDNLKYYSNGTHGKNVSLTHGKNVSLTLGMIEATDWEIYCEEHDWVNEHNLNCKPMERRCGILGCNSKICSNCGIEKPKEKKESLSDKIVELDIKGINFKGLIGTEDVKEKVQNAQKRVRELIIQVGTGAEVTSSVNEIFKEEFGEDLL